MKNKDVCLKKYGHVEKKGFKEEVRAKVAQKKEKVPKSPVPKKCTAAGSAQEKKPEERPRKSTRRANRCRRLYSTILTSDIDLVTHTPFP